MPFVRTALALATFAATATAATAAADTTVPISGIGTQVGAISTRVDHVTHSRPELVEIPGVGKVYEVTGTVHGVGWGGIGLVARARSAHYSYEIPFVARWPRHHAGKTLVAFHHGGSPPPIAVAQADRALGAENNHRFAELTGDLAAGIPALLEDATYVSMNRRGLTADGTFGAKFLTSEVPPLTQAEVDAARAAIAPGDAAYTHPDLFAGAPVPAGISTDSPVVRDVNRALQVVVADLARRKFREKIFIGTSSGSIAGSGLAFGCSSIGTACLRTGGNHLVPYDERSPRLFDGFIMNGFVYNSTAPRADAEQPLAAPVFFVQGRGDERYQHPIRMAHELLEKGVTLDGSVWIYEIANQPHVTRDVPLAVVPSGDHAEPLGPYLGAAIRNMRELLDCKRSPPRSRIAGRIVDGILQFDVAGGTTIEMPVREDPALDTTLVDPLIVVRFIEQGLELGATARWQAVTAALRHHNEDVVGPSLACRTGAYEIRFFGAGFTPFSPTELEDLYDSFRGYRRCVKATVADLERERLYDPRVESARETAERERALFTPAP